MPQLAISKIIDKITDKFEITHSEIINLSQYLSPLSVKGCLTIVDNIVGIEMPPTKFPIILRTPLKPDAIGPLSRYLKCDNYIKYPPKNFQIAKDSVRFCLIHPVNLAFESKPWKCQVHFAIPLIINNMLRPIKKSDWHSVLSLFSEFNVESREHPNYNSEQSVLPSSQSTLLVLVSTESHLNYFQAKMWITLLTRWYGYVLVNQIQIYFHVQLLSANMGRLFGAIDSVSVFCKLCVVKETKEKQMFKSISKE